MTNADVLNVLRTYYFISMRAIMSREVVYT